MNKLVEREYDYIKGSTVAAPERKSRVLKPNRKYKQIQRQKRIKNKNALLKNQRKNDRKYLLTIAVVIFTFGCITISGDNKLYSIQEKVSDIDTQIRQTQEENEALKVSVLKYSSLKNIQENAGTKLSMFIPNKEEIVKIDFSDNYFKDLEPKNSANGSEKENNLFSKLMSLIKS